MDDSSGTLDPTTLTSETTQAPPAEKAKLPTEPTASTTAPESLGSETTILAEACKLQDKPREEFISRFLQLIRTSEFEFGFSTPADEYVREALDTYGTFAREWISELFHRSFDDPFVLSSILRVIAHFDYSQMYPQGMLMAAACVAHTDTDVRECCVRCFESWKAPKTLNILQNISFSQDWLNDYLAGVIKDLEGLANHVVSH